MDQIKEFVNRQRASVLYYSVASGFLYSWLIVPTKGKHGKTAISFFFVFCLIGVIKFHAISLDESENCDNEDVMATNSGLLERLVTAVRESLGVELSPCTTINEDQYSEDTMSERTGTGWIFN